MLFQDAAGTTLWARLGKAGHDRDAIGQVLETALFAWLRSTKLADEVIRSSKAWHRRYNDRERAFIVDMISRVIERRG